MKKFFMALGLIAAISMGCGGKEKLSDAQKAKLKATTNAVGAAVDVTRSAPKTTRMELGYAAKRSSSPRTENETKMISSLDACEYNFGGDLVSDQPNPETFSTPSKKSTRQTLIDMTISGQACPVSAKYKIYMTPNMTSANSGSVLLELDMNYQVLNDEYRQLTDVDLFTLAGKMEMKGSSGDMTFDGRADGKVRSKKDGDINFYLVQSGKGTTDDGETCKSGSGECTIGVEFSDFTGELTTNYECQNGAFKASGFSVNGEEITKAEYEAYLKRFTEATQISCSLDSENNSSSKDSEKNTNNSDDSDEE